MSASTCPDLFPEPLCSTHIAILSLILSCLCFSLYHHNTFYSVKTYSYHSRWLYLIISSVVTITLAGGNCNHPILQVNKLRLMRLRALPKATVNQAGLETQVCENLSSAFPLFRLVSAGSFLFGHLFLSNKPHGSGLTALSLLILACSLLYLHLDGSWDWHH